jgi:hypothetical protein
MSGLAQLAGLDVDQSDRRTFVATNKAKMPIPQMRIGDMSLLSGLHGLRSFVRQHSYTLIFWGAIMIMIIVVVYLVFTETPEHSAAIQEYQRQAAQEKKAIEERNKLICHLYSVCKKFSASRQECAVAGSYSRCMEIKMGGDNDLIGLCTSDGDVNVSYYPPSVQPSRAECLAYDWGLLKQ